jgi:hypothetical protein
MSLFDEINEVERLLSSGPPITKMDERSEAALTSLFTPLQATDPEQFENLIFDLVAVYEDKLRASGLPSAPYCLQWLEEKRAERQRGFSP